MSRRDGKYWDKSWNPLRDSRGGFHCTKCSPGCRNCWAEKINLLRYKDHPYDNTPVTYALDENTMAGDVIYKVRPKIVFVCDLCDLFHDLVPENLIGQVFSVMSSNPHNRYLVLTKRVRRMKEFILAGKEIPGPIWPGATICSQKEADEKIPILQATAARHRWLSIEPMLERIKLPSLSGIDWVTVGCESMGVKAGRPSWWTWTQDIIAACRAANIPVWVKQIDWHGELVRNIKRLPADVRVREWPAEFKINEVMQ